MRRAAIVGFAGVCLLLAAGGSAAMSASAKRGAEPYWGSRAEAVLPANASIGISQSVFLGSVSCPAAGACSAVGSYVDRSGNTEGLLLTETAGRWASGVEAALPQNAAGISQLVSLNSVSCASAGNCSAVGSYLDKSGNTEGLLLSENGGRWGAGVRAVLPANAVLSGQFVYISSVSCSSAGNCSAVGSYNEDSSGNGRGLLLTESAGRWAAGIEAAPPANAATPDDVGLSAVSCASSGECGAVGTYGGVSERKGLLVSEAAGRWGVGVEADLPGNAAATQPEVDLTAISCPSAGYCSAIGTYDTVTSNDGVLLTETAGNWAKGITAVLPGNAATPDQIDLNALSCPSVGNCAAVGGFVDRNGNMQELVLTETAGLWLNGVQAVPPANAASGAKQTASIDSVSCASAGNCSAVGHYTVRSGHGLFAMQGLLLIEKAGNWATGIEATPPSRADTGAYLASVSCASVESCNAVGGYGALGAVQGLLVGGSVTPSCLVPKLKGKTLTAADRSIKTHRCSIGRTNYTSSPTVKTGHVISQHPAPGKRLKHGTKINLVISRGVHS